MAFTYIIGGKIVLPEAVIEGKALAYSEETGKIEGVVDTVPQGAKTIDAGGNYVAPGLVDIHIHGYLGEDTCDAKPEGIKKMAYGVAQNGVTSFLPTTMTVAKNEIIDALNAVRSVKEESKTWQADIIGIGSILDRCLLQIRDIIPFLLTNIFRITFSNTTGYTI